MGIFFSEPARPKTPPPKKLTDKPWRQPSFWDARVENQLLDEIKDMRPNKRPNVLLVGPVGAGKSSFINSIISIAKERKYSIAGTGNAEKSWTLNLNRYTEGTLLQQYSLFDCMGIEPLTGSGFHVDDITFLIKGHIKEGYNFNPTSPITNKSAEYRDDPTFDHQMHCVVYVMNARTIYDGVPTAYLQQIKQLQAHLQREHVPRVIILTKVDELCSEVNSDITNLFQSVKVEEAVKIASEVFGIGRANIHPVKNYENEYDIDAMTNIPLLLALRQIMHNAADRIEYFLRQENEEF